MCGRFVLDRRATDLVTLFEIDLEGQLIPEPSWNIAPTDRIAIVLDSLPRSNDPDDQPPPVRRLESARWGLVPGWSTGASTGAPLFNARVEGITDKPSFRDSVTSRRAVVPATGYYEWQVTDGAKSPQFVSLPGGETMIFAALYDWWRDPAAAAEDPARWLLSATILTRPSAGPLSELHDRMPVFLDADLLEEWLDPQVEGDQELVELVADAAEEVAGRAQFHEVDAAVGSVRNNGSQLITPVFRTQGSPERP